MIKYTLRCPENHRFDSWFASSEGFEKLASAGLLSCAVCGATKVEKALMAPNVQLERGAQTADVPTTVPVPEQPDNRGDAAPVQQARDSSEPSPEQMLKALRKHIETSSDYVGSSFAMEARKMHVGDAPNRSIYGEANRAEVKSLLEDGVAIAPLPFIPTRKTN